MLVLKYVVALFGLYFLYAFVTGVLLFMSQPIAEHNGSENLMMEGENKGHSQDRVVLVEEREEAGIARLNLIENAQSSLDIAYHTLHEGIASDLFFASIIDAADRGVQVRFILDGVLHNLRGNNKAVIFAFASHPNIELKFYEPFHALQPWTWNNRLHDKLLIVDNELAMIGGRNIGDSYFARPGYEGAKNDRDVVIINTEPENQDTSVLIEMKKYFNLVWHHPYTKDSATHVSERQRQKGLQRMQELERTKDQHVDLFNRNIDWVAISVPTNRITFLHNPIERLNKEPIVWRKIQFLIDQAEESIYIQSPYIIPTKKMIDESTMRGISAKEITILTNSLAATPNVLAYSGYMHHRVQIARSNVDLYEFQGPKESLHTKTYLFDKRYSVIGSFNIDSRSAYLSTESVVVIDSTEFAEQVEKKMNMYLNQESLLVLDDGSYQYHPWIEEKKPSCFKRGLTKALSFVTRYFQYML
ncbi:phospholipase D family protein [Alkalihalobacillus sp. MEB130]|uniref:phospholipase D-like domain-containing protein n=1 Tax=Alkalihalobacillus sp. MEB130 TaxID=2976704 RepID=UPI0028DE2A9B|nr:phospholipase D family protein [Alkalihalobacillus sp. MEB130]MDT8862184.1 phospholipase D family protein [Alkalihalobacillus sp. MEB130]